MELEINQFLRLKEAVYDNVLPPTTSFLHDLAVLADAATPLSAELRLIDRRGKFPEIFDLYRTQTATIEQIRDFYRLTVD